MRTDKKIYIEKTPDNKMRKITTTVIVEEEIIDVRDLLVKKKQLIQQRDDYMEKTVKVELFKYEQQILQIDQQVQQLKQDGIEFKEIK